MIDNQFISLIYRMNAAINSVVLQASIAAKALRRFDQCCMNIALNHPINHGPNKINAGRQGL